jgi:hypothetical protein
MWRDTLDAFSRAHQAWLITLECSRPDAGPVILMRNVPLLGVFDDDTRLVIATADHGGHADHVVPHPVTVQRQFTSGGATLGLDIETHGGERVRLRFRSAIAPELVDGVARFAETRI